MTAATSWVGDMPTWFFVRQPADDEELCFTAITYDPTKHKTPGCIAAEAAADLYRSRHVDVDVYRLDSPVRPTKAMCDAAIANPELKVETWGLVKSQADLESRLPLRASFVVVLRSDIRIDTAPALSREFSSKP